MRDCLLIASCMSRVCLLLRDMSHIICVLGGDAVHPRLLHGRGGAALAQPGKSVRWCTVLWLMHVSPA